MPIKDALSRAGTQGRNAVRRGMEKASSVMDSASSIADRVVCNPDPDEIEPKPVKAKPIVSVNGEDVDRTFAEENLNLPEKRASSGVALR